LQELQLVAEINAGYRTTAFIAEKRVRKSARFLSNGMQLRKSLSAQSFPKNTSFRRS
jgi:hypothetical protein